MESTITLGIIDDSITVRESFAKFLAARGVNIVFVAENGCDGLEKLAACNKVPDTCLLDVEMPELDGFETAVRIKTRFPNVKIVMYSMAVDKYDERKAIAAGADMLLSKGGDIDDLIKAISVNK